jgi:hypothetical protein
MSIQARTCGSNGSTSQSPICSTSGRIVSRIAIDEFTHKCLAIRVDRKLNSADAVDVLSDRFIPRGVPEHIRSDYGSEFAAKSVQDWIGAVGAKTASPRERLRNPD